MCSDTEVTPWLFPAVRQRPRATEPGQQRSAGGRRDRMRKRHVREMNVGDAAHGRFGRRAFDAEIVETDPGEFHRLGRQEQRCQGNGRVTTFQQKRGGGMVDSKPVTLNPRPIYWWPRD
jgi:hypothetical protein